MNKLRNVIIIILMTLFTMLVCSTKVSAYSVGQYLYVGSIDVVNGSFMCMQHNQSAPSGTYRVIETVNIEGIKSVSATNGKTVVSKENARWAYIFSSYSNQIRSNSPLQHCVWNKMKGTWISSVGVRHNGSLGGGFHNGVYGPWWGQDQALWNAATSYSDKFNSSDGSMKLVDKTKNAKTYIDDETEEVRIGPITWQIPGSVSVKVTDQSGKEISGVKFYTYVGNKKKEISASDIKSNKSFYIGIPKSKITDKCNKIKVTPSINVKCVKLSFLQALNGAMQNLVHRSPYTKPFSETFEYTVNSRIKIQKVDEETGKPLKKVHFIVQRTDNEQYLAVQDDNLVWKENISDATIYVTNDNGVKIIQNVPANVEYAIYEIKNENPGYKVDKDQILDKKLASAGKTALFVEKNHYGTGNLRIIKEEKDNPDVKVKAKFVVSYVGIFGNDETEKYLIQDEKGNYSFSTKKEQATKFETNSETGIIELPNVPIGNYYVEEVESDEYHFRVEKKGPLTLEEGQTIEFKSNDPEDSEQDIADPIIPGKLQIVKVNEQNQQCKLAGVGFQIYREATKQYVYIREDGSIGYQSEQASTPFYTDENGEIVLDGVAIGKYTIIEVEQPHYGYELIEPRTVEVKPSLKQIVNEKGELELVPTEIEPELFVIPNPQKWVRISGFVWIDRMDGKSDDESHRSEKYKDNTEGIVDTQDILYDGIEVRLMDKTTGQVAKDKNGNDLITKTMNTSDMDGMVDIYGSTISEYGGYKGYSEDQYLNGHNGHGAYLFNDVIIENLENYYVEFEYDGLTYTNVVPHIDNEKDKNGSKAAEETKVREAFNQSFAYVEGSDDRSKGVTRSSADGDVERNLEYELNEQERSAKLTNASKTEILEGSLAVLEDLGSFSITARTDTEESGYVLSDHFTYGDEEIRYVNLGLKEREQPNLELGKDLQNVRLAINGYEHTYNYNTRYVNEGDYTGEGFNVGVKWGDKYSELEPYSRAIYKSDFDFESSDKDRELKVYVTYKILLGNKSDVLDARVNSIIEYFDAKYEQIIAVGTKLDEKGNIIDGHMENGEVQDYADGYKKVIINTDTIINPLSTTEMYIQFLLSRQGVATILEDGQVTEDELLDNVAEINSYSIYREGKIYAGIDQNSAPANAVPGKIETYEDDAERSPALKLEVVDARDLKGQVFLDNVEGPDADKLRTGQERKGNGVYDDGEKGLQGVTVTLKEESGTGLEYKAETMTKQTAGWYTTEYDATTKTTKIQKLPAEQEGAVYVDVGQFFIPGFIPGDYTVTYEWGNDTYFETDSNEKVNINVQNYKGTIYVDEARYNKIQSDTDREAQNVQGMYWYREEQPRMNDATDNWQTRQEIDEQLKHVVFDSSPDKDSMDSKTPKFAIGIEYSKNRTQWNAEKDIWNDETVDGLKYHVINVDFGIVERPRQEIQLVKRVKTVRVVFTSGQELANFEIKYDEATGKRTVEGNRNSVTYMEPLEGSNLQTSNGFVKVELDNELLQDTKIYVGYEIKVTNISELDYDSQRYYNYGTVDGNVITITPKGIIDYLDNEWTYEDTLLTEHGGIWQVKSYDDTYNKMVSKDVFDNQKSEINQRKMLYTDKLSDKVLEPTQSATVTIDVLKAVTPTDEISLDNEAEIVEIQKTGGSRISTIPGNYIPGLQQYMSEVLPAVGANMSQMQLYETDSSIAETTMVTSSTGANQNYILPITLGISLLAILGAGVVIIKKKVIKN